MPRGRMKHLQLVAGRIYNLLKKEAPPCGAAILTGRKPTLGLPTA